MDSSACRRIIDSYELMVPRIDEMVAGFYARLFEACPETRRLFPQDMTIQREHLAASLALVARNIEHFDVLAESIMILGAEHIGFGALPQHYPMVRDAMLASMQEILGEKFTSQLHEDWYSALSGIIALMLRGAVEAALGAMQEK